MNNIPIKLIILSLRRIHWKLKLWVVWLRNFESSNLTFDLQRSTQVKNMFCCLKAHIIEAYLILIHTSYLEVFLRSTFYIKFFYWHFLSISYRFRDIWLRSFQGLISTFDLWRSSGVKKFIPLENPYMTSYLTSMDTISLSHTVFEIFDFEVFRVWPWPLTSKGHLGSKYLIPFESPYMTSYLTSMDTISLSHTVFEIFDFEVFRVCPWPLTSEGHLGSKHFIPHESPYMNSYLTSMDTISLSRHRFRDIRLQSFQSLTSTFDLWRSSGVIKCYTFRKFIYDFLFDFYGHHLSIS